MSDEWLGIDEEKKLFCKRCGGGYLPDYGHYPPDIILKTVNAFLGAHLACQPHQKDLDRGKPLCGVKTAMEVTVMDPACGTGMILIEAFHMLVPMRVAEEGIPEWVAAELVLRDNLFGLDIDPRAIQLASFSLTLEAWKLGASPMKHKRKDT